MSPSLPFRRIADLTGTGGAVGALLVVGLVSGVDVWTVETLHGLAFLEGSFSAGVLSVLAAVTGLYVVHDAWTGTDTEPVRSGPEVRAIVPAYRDADVLDISVGSLLESGYENLSVVVVTEPDDPTTREKARELAEEHEAVDALVNRNPGSKGMAINHAVDESDADHFAVFDADERVSPGFVPTAMGEILGGADVFQGRRVPRGSGPVETLAYCERLVVQMGYSLGDIVGFTNCLSSSTVFTREAIEEVGGYKDRLTEDIEFAHSCNSADLELVQDRSATNSMEAPHTLTDFWGQRKRWRIGQVEVFRERVREAFEGETEPEDLKPAVREIGAVVAGGLLLVILTQMAIVTLRGAGPTPLPFAIQIATAGVVWTRDALDGHVGTPSWTIALAPVVLLMHGALTFKSLTEYHLTWEGEWYRVSKTGS